MNQALKRGEYFWADIVRDGIVLYELPNHPLATPVPLTKFDAVRMAERFLEEKLDDAESWLKTATFQMSEAESHAKFRKLAAFSLHQATEAAYACFLLSTTFYFPKSHNIKFLRSLAEGKEQQLIEAWPRGTKLDRRRFELLKRAYVEARYSPNYSITIEDLDALYASVKRLRDIVAKLGEKRIAELSRS